MKAIAKAIKSPTGSALILGSLLLTAGMSLTVFSMAASLPSLVLGVGALLAAGVAGLLMD